MADMIDVANDLIDNEVNRALNKIRKQAASGGEGTKTCIECDDAMHIERQKLGFNLCKVCAEEKERRQSQYKE